MDYYPDEEFKALAKKIHETGEAKTLTPIQLIGYFGVTRRKVHVKWWVDKALEEHNLTTVPNYKSAWQYAEIELRLQKTEEDIKDNPEKASVDEATLTATKKDENIPRIQLLEAANTTPISISKNDFLKKAITLMMENNFSQLPVMNRPESRDVDGMISWHSIGWKTSLGVNGEYVKDYMTSEFTIVSSQKPLLDAIEIIKEKRVVLVRKSSDRSIGGLVTIADIVDEYHKLAEPFFIIGEIEACLREIIGDKFTIEELSAVKHGDDDREISTVSNLNFNEYIELMRAGDNWDKLGLPLDKATFTERLVEIRYIRNDVMHFNADDIEESQRKVLRATAKFLREILA